MRQGLKALKTKLILKEPSRSSPLRSDGSPDGHAGRLDRVTGAQRPQGKADKQL
jgi:hypothetical protein